jgi:hypothetical protein
VKKKRKKKIDPSIIVALIELLGGVIKLILPVVIEWWREEHKEPKEQD